MFTIFHCAEPHPRYFHLCRGTACRAPTYKNQIVEQFGKRISGSISTINRSNKSEATRRVNILRQTPGKRLWKRNYYERVIRIEKAFQSISEYILANPANWHVEDGYSINRK